MLNADDSESVLSLRLLAKTATDATKPLVLWIGAGASRWLGYPSWQELALHMRRIFFLSVAQFDNQRALALINREEFPAFFEICRELDHGTYHKTVAEEFLPKESNQTYREFVELLSKLKPLFVLTTNVDEVLDSALPTSAIVQKTDLTRCLDLIGKRLSFVAKLHGSVSAIQSTVFTTSDYAVLTADVAYVQTLKHIFANCTVLFMAYGIRDSYVIRLLKENSAEMDLFGAGPHFAVTNESIPESSIRSIRYSLKVRPDHSAALHVLRVITQSLELKTPLVAASTVASALEGPNQQVVPAGKTAYYISDLFLPGTFSTSQEVVAKAETHEIEAIVGLGFVDDEVPLQLHVSTAMHDLVVGLLCFDYTYVPTLALGNLFTLIGEALVRELVETDVVRFIYSETQLAITFERGGVIGGVANLLLNAEIGTNAPAPLRSRIRRMLTPVPGKEKEAELLIDLLERRTSIYKRGIEVNVPALVRSALLMPKVAELLGIGEAISPTQAPRWLRYPYLRLAHLVETGTFCTEFGIQAAKVPFGGPSLTSAAFGVQRVDDYADHLASYVSSDKNFNSDLGALLYQNPAIMQGILSFRSSSEGEAFRRETAAVLATGTGREFSASVNAGLTRAIPVNILQRAHDKMLALMTASPRIVSVPAVWADIRHDDSITKLWRARSKKLLMDICKSRGVGKNDPCICESGDKLRLCCLAPLGH